jgi:mono/diheme cytochrome c family protein
MRYLAILGLAAILGMAACGRKEAGAPEPVVAPAEAPISTPEPVARPFDAAALGIPDDAEIIADGREIAVTNCATCHGLDGDASPRADAPPLRHVLSILPPESLAEDFRAGIHVGHEDMPAFEFGDMGMDVLLSYLVSIQETPPE